MVALHTVIAILLVVALIIKVKVDPVISLVLASIYLGLATGVGFAETLKVLTGGFGEIMAEVGLLIGFGVLIGSLLQATGAFERMVKVLVTAVGARRLPVAMAAALSTVFPSIYVDVQVVLASPVARSAAGYIGPHGTPWMASSLATGIFSGYVFVVPGLAAISIAGLLKIPLGTYLLFGIILGPLTAIATTLLMRQVLRVMPWHPDTDEDRDGVEPDPDPAPAADAAPREDGSRGRPSLFVSFLPILVPLLLIALGAFAQLFDWNSPLIAFLGDANIALFLGLLGAYVLARRHAGTDRASEAMTSGFHTSGEILLITGIGGSLGGVIKATGLDKQLASLFSADAGAPVLLSILLAWFVAAVLHLAIGSVSVAAITAAGIIAPILGQIPVAPIAVGLAIASGSLFALHVNSNFFWMFSSLLRLTTQGTLKTLTLVTAVSSLVSLPVIMLVALAA